MTSLLKRPERSARSMPLRELTAASAVPVATVSANLMPPEVLAKRRLGWLKRRLAFGLVVILALVGVGYALARSETASSNDALATEQQRGADFGQRLRTFDDVVRIQGDTATLRQQLASVMATDLQWSPFLTSLGTAAPKGVSLTAVDVKIGTPTTAGGVPATPAAGTAPGAVSVGTLTLSGVAPDYRSVAGYVDSLGRVKGIVDVQPGNVASGGSTTGGPSGGTAAGSTTFTITTSLTAAVFGGRFTKPGGN